MDRINAIVGLPLPITRRNERLENLPNYLENEYPHGIELMHKQSLVRPPEYCQALKVLPLPISTAIMVSEFIVRFTTLEMYIEEFLEWSKEFARVGEDVMKIIENNKLHPKIVPPLISEYMEAVSSITIGRPANQFVNAIAIGYVANQPKNEPAQPIMPDNDPHYYPSYRYDRAYREFRHRMRLIETTLDDIGIDGASEYMREILPTIMEDPFLLLKKAMLAEYNEYVMNGVFPCRVEIELALWPNRINFMTPEGQMSANLYTGDIEPYKTLQQRAAEWQAARQII